MTSWLIDKSAYTRIPLSADAGEWMRRVERGLVHITTLTRLEMGYSARSGAGLRDEVARPPLSWMPLEHLTPSIEDRAMAVQMLLADRGHHRAASVPDLLISATAEIAGLTVLHVDKDLDLIADVTGQPMERLALA